MRAKQSVVIVQNSSPGLTFLQNYLGVGEFAAAAASSVEVVSLAAVEPSVTIPVLEKKLPEMLNSEEFSAWFEPNKFYFEIKQYIGDISYLASRPIWLKFMECMPETEKFTPFWIYLLKQRGGLTALKYMLKRDILPFDERLWTDVLLSAIGSQKNGQDFLANFLLNELTNIERLAPDSMIWLFFYAQFRQSSSFLRNWLGDAEEHRLKWQAFLTKSPNLFQFIFQGPIEPAFILAEQLTIINLAILAVKQGSRDLLASLVSNGADLKKPAIAKKLLFTAFEHEHFDLIAWMREEGARVFFSSTIMLIQTLQQAKSELKLKNVFDRLS